MKVSTSTASVFKNRILTNSREDFSCPVPNMRQAKTKQTLQLLELPKNIRRGQYDPRPRISFRERRATKLLQEAIEDFDLMIILRIYLRSPQKSSEWTS